MLTLHVAMLDARALQNGGAMTGHDQRAYLAFSNSLSRALRDLGLDPAAAAAPTLNDLLAAPPRNHRAPAPVAASRPVHADPAADDTADAAGPLAGFHAAADNDGVA